ncbi:MAG: acyl-CoA dehydratase activase-related protein [Bacillota bacterium]|jgi:predicted nucleotide-binding protein (sugar kinase/HSP70/actin superfamily)
MRKKIVGIPKGLLYHYYYTHWENFFKILGFEVKVSPNTNKRIINNGIMAAVDEACLPVKAFYGHVLDLVDEVDYLFLPRVVSVTKKEYMCPKLLGIPDMLKASLHNPPCLIDTTINLRNNNAQIDQAIKEICTIIQVPVKQGFRAWQLAENDQRQYELYLQAGNLPVDFNLNQEGFPIALLGHGYNIYDSYINMGMIQKLHDLGASVWTKEMVPANVIDNFAGQLPKRMFWTFGKQLLGSGLYYLSNPKVKGIIFVASFGCGPDSMVGDLLERWARRRNQKPFMFITLDEHSGEAGLITRLEAFMDMIR